MGVICFLSSMLTTSFPKGNGRGKKKKKKINIYKKCKGKPVLQ
jgi:hypothetical protein